MITDVAIQPLGRDQREATSIVEVRGLTKSIDERRVLRGVSFRVSAGEYIAILGTNGAGKSTLLRILSTLTPPTGGEVTLFGQSVVNAPASLRRRIGLIDHQPLLYRDLTALENLAFFAGLYGLPEPQRRARRMLEAFGLLPRANDPAKAFSRGMLQRLAIARALLHDPELILADEPFTGLDAPSIELVERLFADLVAAGKTVVIVNHDIEQTLRLADRVVVLRGGTVSVDQPTHRLYLEELLAEVRG